MTACTSTALTGTRSFPTFSAFFTPQINTDITCDPYLDTSAEARRRTNHAPTHHRPFCMIEDCQSNVCRGPAYPLKCEETDEGGQRWIVGLPSSKKPGCQCETLVSCQNRLLIQLARCGMCNQISDCTHKAATKKSVLSGEVLRPPQPPTLSNPLGGQMR